MGNGVADVDLVVVGVGTAVDIVVFVMVDVDMVWRGWVALAAPKAAFPARTAVVSGGDQGGEGRRGGEVEAPGVRGACVGESWEGSSVERVMRLGGFVCAVNGGAEETGGRGKDGGLGEGTWSGQRREAVAMLGMLGASYVRGVCSVVLSVSGMLL